MRTGLEEKEGQEREQDLLLNVTSYGAMVESRTAQVRGGG